MNAEFLDRLTTSPEPSSRSHKLGCKNHAQELRLRGEEPQQELPKSLLLCIGVCCGGPRRGPSHSSLGNSSPETWAGQESKMTHQHYNGPSINVIRTEGSILGII